MSELEVANIQLAIFVEILRTGVQSAEAAKQANDVFDVLYA